MEPFDLFLSMLTPFGRARIEKRTFGIERTLVTWQSYARQTAAHAERLARALRKEQRIIEPLSKPQQLEWLIRSSFGKGYRRKTAAMALEQLGYRGATASVEHYCATHGILQDSMLQMFLPSAVNAALWDAAVAGTPLIPAPNAIGTRDYLQMIFSGQTTAFLNRLDTITKTIPERQRYRPHYLQSLGDLRDLLCERLGNQPALRESLTAVMQLDPAYTARTIDVLACLDPDAPKNRGYDGWTMRVKSNESLARKLAARTVAVTAAVDTHQRQKLPPEHFALTFEEFTITDILGAMLLPVKQNADDAINRCISAGMVEIDRTDSRAHRTPSAAWQIQSKLYDPETKLIIDFHVSTLPSIAALEFGSSAHHRRRVRTHQERMRGPYGRQYRESYERALEFLEACNIPGINVHQYGIIGDPRHPSTDRRTIGLYDLRQRLFSNLGITPYEVERFAHESPRAVAKWLRENGKRIALRDLSRVLDCHLWAWQEALEGELFDREKVRDHAYVRSTAVEELERSTVALAKMYLANAASQTVGLGLRAEQFLALRPILDTAAAIAYANDAMMGAFEVYALDNTAELPRQIRAAQDRLKRIPRATN